MNIFGDYIFKTMSAKRLVFQNIFKKIISTQQTEDKLPSKKLATDLNWDFIKKKYGWQTNTRKDAQHR